MGRLNTAPTNILAMARLINNVTKIEIEVRASYNHPACSYGRAVWVDKNNQAYTQIGMPTPLYTIIPDEQDERERIGHIISELRKDAGLSQTDLAKKIDCARSYISAIENGKQHISINVLTNIASALGAKVEVVKSNSH